MLPKSPLPVLVLAISLTTNVGGSLLDFARISNNNNDQHHRSLDAAEDCVTATIGKSEDDMEKVSIGNALYESGNFSIL